MNLFRLRDGNSTNQKFNVRALFSVALVLACFAVSPVAQAVPPPKPEDRGNGNSAAENVQALNLQTTGSNNTAHGWFSLFSNTTGSANTADGFQALNNNTTGFQNTANGSGALGSNTTGNFNTATGGSALFSNTTGTNNTANGLGSLLSNTTGSANTATGNFALASNTTADGNTANGASALVSNTTGANNTAIGAGALLVNTADINTATGAGALLSNTTGNANVANGALALQNNTIGFSNSAFGYYAMQRNITGNNNTAIGDSALGGPNTTGSTNTAIGSFALTNSTGSGNTALGYGAGANVITADNVICIGTGGQDVSNSCYIGNIFGQTSFEGVGVFVNSDGKLGTSLSSRRFKKDIRAMDKASEAILAFKPVTFHYKTDTKGTAQFGLIAEEVAEVNPDLIVRDKDGKPYSVRYDQVNAMLLNEFLKEHRKVEQLTKDFESKLAEQQKQIEALTAGLQKVSAQLEASKPAPRVVNNP
jgi:trimeric autotransporter adhesin